MAFKSGWIAAALILIAATIPLLYRARLSKRAPPESKAIRGHVMLGLATSLATFLHTGLVLPELGSEAAVGGGSYAFLVGALAFLVMVAHGGLGLGLRNPKLRDRAKRRRTHATTAVILVSLVALHVVLLRRGAK
jgi:cytochrome b561